MAAGGTGLTGSVGPEAPTRGTVVHESTVPGGVSGAEAVQNLNLGSFWHMALQSVCHLTTPSACHCPSSLSPAGLGFVMKKDTSFCFHVPLPDY